MTKLMGFIGMTVASWLGYMVARPFGMVAAFLFSTVAGGFGMYYAARWARNTFG